MGIFSFGLLYAQVGINTQTPQGIFHIDNKGDTSGTTNMKDDIVIASDGGSGVGMSIGGAPVTGASIALHSEAKGFVPNRVKLTSALDITTVPSPVEGMVVYNTLASGIYPDNTLPGYYSYNGSRWKRLRTAAYLGVSETRSLQASVTTVSSTTIAALDAPVLNFGGITIFEDGAYAFSFNIAGTSSTGALTDKITRGILYIHVLKKSVGESAFSVFQTIEVNPPLFPNGQSFTITAIAGMELKAEDELKFTARHYSTYPSITLTGNTYLVYWKL
ncbi:hypothetical protein SAMN05444362_101268 [Dysgonomonas macrotermitis]|uniref:C1q domain-containing protein n=2 Tax=Dysgonomonas macrotermitis TaxID=1346286 RepID=A0A1M4T908_9BACT|nr:hypothetical protein SAMN05444362_101268 [Dysgonomonas macrotermitis]